MADMSIQQKYDIIVHLVGESGLSAAEQLAGVRELFPKFDPSDLSNDDMIDDYVLEKYAYSRSVGLSVDDSAHSAEVSATLMRKASVGEGLSLETFIAIAKAELYSVAIMKRKHLAGIDDSGGNNYKASIAFLEKLYPDQYGQRIEVKDEGAVAIAHSNMEIARRLSFILTQAIRSRTSGVNDDGGTTIDAQPLRAIGGGGDDRL